MPHFMLTKRRSRSALSTTRIASGQRRRCLPVRMRSPTYWRTALLVWCGSEWRPAPLCGLAVEQAGGAADALDLHRCTSRERCLEEASRQDGPERLCRPCPNRAHRLNQAGSYQDPHQLEDSFAAHGARDAGAHSRQDRERPARASACLRRAVRQTPRRLAESMAKPNHASGQHRPGDVLSVFDLATIMVSHVRNVLPGAFRSF